MIIVAEEILKIVQSHLSALVSHLYSAGMENVWRIDLTAYLLMRVLSQNQLSALIICVEKL